MNQRADDRASQAGLVLATAGHLILLGLLSIAWGQRKPPPPPLSTPVEVSLVADVAPEATAPPAAEPPAPSIAPEAGPPEDAALPPAPTPAKPAPPTPAPPQPAPAKPAPAKPAPPEPAPAKPAPAPKPVAAKSAPAKPQPAAKPAPAKPQPATQAAPAKAQPSAKAAPAKAAPVAPRPSRLAGIVASVANGASPAATAARPRGARLGDDFLKGLSPDAPKRPASAAAPAAKAGPYPTASIVAAIARQIQPCADRQVNPGPGANRIVTTLNIRLNPDGTLAATPTKVRQSGVDDENDRYAQRVVDLGIAAFKGCSPLRLPNDYYETASGGWNNINYQWQLR